MHFLASLHRRGTIAATASVMLGCALGSGFAASPTATLTATTTVVQQAVPCPASLSAGMDIDIPKLHLAGSSYHGVLKLNASPDGAYIAKVTRLEATSRGDCAETDSGIVLAHNNTYLLHIPSLAAGAGQYWANLELLPSTDGTTLLKLTQYGSKDAGVSGEVSGEGSAYLSLAQTTLVSSSDTKYQFRRIFPGGTAVDVGVTLLANQVYTPTADEVAAATMLGVQTYGAKFAHATSADAFNFNVQYFVPYSALPPSTVTRLKAAGAAPRNAFAAEQSGVGVVVESVGMGFGKEAVTQLAEKGFGKAGDVAAKGIGSALDVLEAWSTGVEHDHWMKRLNAAEYCAKMNLDVGVRQQVLDSISAARSELKANTGVKFVGMIAGGVLDAVAAPLFPVSAGTNGYVGDAMRSVNEQTVKAVEQAAGRCDINWKVTFEGTGSYDYEDRSSNTQEHADFTWKIVRDKVSFTDNTRGNQSANYGITHAQDWGVTSRALSGHYSYVQDNGKSGSNHYRMVCSGTIYHANFLPYDADVLSGSVEISDNLALPYPPAPEFRVVVPGFEAPVWNGTCTETGVTEPNYPADGALVLSRSVNARFDMPADFRFNGVNQDVSGRDSVTDFSGATTTIQWSGIVSFVAY